MLKHDISSKFQRHRRSIVTRRNKIHNENLSNNGNKTENDRNFSWYEHTWSLAHKINEYRQQRIVIGPISITTICRARVPSSIEFRDFWQEYESQYQQQSVQYRSQIPSYQSPVTGAIDSESPMVRQTIDPQPPPSIHRKTSPSVTHIVNLNEIGNRVMVANTRARVCTYVVHAYVRFNAMSGRSSWFAMAVEHSTPKPVYPLA